MEIWLVVFTSVLAVFTALLFFVAYLTLKKQGDYYKATTRPFVNLKIPKIINMDYKENRIEFAYDFKNYGNTPAKDVQSKSEFFAEINLKYKKDFEKGKRICSIFPNDSLLITKDKWHLVNGEKESFFHISIIYKDIAENIHNTLNIFLLSTEINNVQLELIHSHFD